MNFNRHFHLDPEPIEGGGGAPIESAPAPDGGAPTLTPSFDPTAFKSEMLGSIRQELGSSFSRFRTELEPHISSSQQAAKEDKAPSIQEFYNSKKELDEEGFAKYLAAHHKFLSKSERSEWEKDIQQKQAQQQSQSAFRRSQTEHIARESEYEKTQPTYRQDLLAAGDMEVGPAVVQRILGSKYSANIIHHFAKNRPEFLKFQRLSYDDPSEAIEVLGELRARFQTSGTPTNLPKPTRAAFGGTGAKTNTRSTDEILKDWRQ